MLTRRRGLAVTGVRKIFMVLLLALYQEVVFQAGDFPFFLTKNQRRVSAAKSNDHRYNQFIQFNRKASFSCFESGIIQSPVNQNQHGKY
jgi:hypothetical protein